MTRRDPPEEDAVAESLRRLAKKSGLSLFALAAPDREAILLACQQHCRGAPLPASESGFTGLVQAWLERTAGFLRTDAAELRRTLVDLGFVHRDRAGRNYTLPPPAEPEAGGPPTDYTEIIVAARAEEREARERRKRLRGETEVG